MTQQQYIIKRKLNIVDFAEQLGNISEACRKLGVSRQHYYDIRGAIELTIKTVVILAAWPEITSQSTRAIFDRLNGCINVRSGNGPNSQPFLLNS